MVDVIIKKSKIHGKGVFANKDFKKGELVVKYNPVKFSESEFKKLGKKAREFICILNGNHIKHRPPAIYINHSCNPNTHVKAIGDFATRDILCGEEITTDYTDRDEIAMPCNCGSKTCRGIIK